jgi:hypothetical protein
MLRLMRRAILSALAALLVAATPALAQAPPAPYDGHNPFACTLQQVGTGTDFPLPAADPFCVEFDKTHQSVADGGVVDFLSNEPARVAAASPKCFYFQRDHWTGSVVQGQPPETYHWDGSYWFDKARGAGGAYLENVRVGGSPADPTVVPGFPDALKPYLAGGRGGYQAVGDVQADPRCATRPNPSGPGGGATVANANGRCRVPGGRIGHGIGGLPLNAGRRRAHAELGGPARESARYAAWCFDGGGRLAAAFGRRDERVQVLLTDSPPFDAHGVRTGSHAATARKRLHGERSLGRAAGARVVCAREKRRRLCVALRGGRVRWVAIGRPAVGRARTLRYLRGAASA